MKIIQVIKNVIIAPQPGGSLTSAKAHHHSMYGEIGSNWIFENEQFKLEVTIPPNATAKVVLPNADSQTVKENNQFLKQGNGIHNIEQKGENVELQIGSGKYTFVYPANGFKK